MTWNAYLSIYKEKESFPEEHNTGARGLLFFKLKHLLKAYHGPRPVRGPFTWVVSFQPHNKPLKYLLCTYWNQGGSGLERLRAPAEVTKRSGRVRGPILEPGVSVLGNCDVQKRVARESGHPALMIFKPLDLKLCTGHIGLPVGL